MDSAGSPDQRRGEATGSTKWRSPLGDRARRTAHSMFPYSTEVIVPKEHRELIVTHDFVQSKDAVVRELRAAIVEELLDEQTCMTAIQSQQTSETSRFTVAGERFVHGLSLSDHFLHELIVTRRVGLHNPPQRAILRIDHPSVQEPNAEHVKDRTFTSALELIWSTNTRSALARVALATPTRRISD